MSADTDLVDRLREHFRDEPAVVEKAMFGGHAFLVAGNMAVCASGHGGLMVRVDPDQSEALLHDGQVDRMVMQGRPLKGWVLVQPAVVSTERELQRWVGIGVDYALSLPAK